MGVIFIKVVLLVVSLWINQKLTGATNIQEKFGRVIGGVNADPNEFPFLIALVLDGSVKCGGTLIAPQYVLTAAHCTEKYRERYIFAIAGEHILSTANAKEQRRGVKTKTIHEKYDNITSENDISLLKLETPFNLTAEVKPIALPDADYVASGYVTVVGWGMTKVDAKERKMSDTLQKLHLPIADYAKCTAAYKEEDVELHNTQLCAGFFKKEGKDSCNGDSGGPLIASVKGTPTLVGITSFGVLECATLGFPGIYTDVAKYHSWIKSKMT